MIHYFKYRKRVKNIYYNLESANTKPQSIDKYLHQIFQLGFEKKPNKFLLIYTMGKCRNQSY